MGVNTLKLRFLELVQRRLYFWGRKTKKDETGRGEKS